jgi:hypothetical protein
MHKVSKIVSIEPVHSKSYYVQANIKALPDIPKGITPGTMAVAKMINAVNVNKGILRYQISTDPNNPEWSKTVKEHWNSLYYLIPNGGKNFEVGFIYNSKEIADKFDERFKQIVKTYKEEAAKATDDKEEVAAFKAKIDAIFDLEVDKNDLVNGEPKYGKPINPEDYLIWLYTLNYSPVAKRVSDIDKSVRIKFLLTDENETKALEKETFDLSLKADEAYIGIINKPDKINYVLKVLNFYKDGLGDIDKKKLIKNESTINPRRFLSIVNDTHLQEKAQIEDLITAGILRRMKDSTVIVDAKDPSILIANNLDEALTFFADTNTTTKAQASEYIARYRALKPKQ